MGYRTFLSLLTCAWLAACGAVDYDAAPAGRFEGALLVMWVGEGSPAAGDGRFVYVPSPARPLTFHRGAGAGPPQVIRPEMMYTDGGSIPRIAQVFRGFSPWGYAPAYVVHDWLYVARHCLTDGTPTEAEQRMAGMRFGDSARIIAEAIKTLIAERRVARDDVAPRVISGAVAGPVARTRWQASGACRASRVSAAHRAEVAAALGRETARTRRPGGAKPARIIAEISF